MNNLSMPLIEELQRGMKRVSDKVIMDTNVPAKAATSPLECKEEELDMQKACIEYVQAFVRNPESKLVMDLGNEIGAEYRRRIPQNTNMGKVFWRWFYTYMARIDLSDNVVLEKNVEGDYLKFPLEERTEKFDLSDRKFIALARTHEEHPPIIEAADGKWLGFQEVFEEYGVHIEFLDLAYVEMMYNRKIVNKNRG